MRDPHGLIIGEVDPETVRLFGAPRLGPASISSSAVSSTDEPHRRAGHQLAIGSGDRAGQAVLRVLSQPIVGGELGDLRAASPPLCVPLCRQAERDAAAEEAETVEEDEPAP